MAEFTFPLTGASTATAPSGVFPFLEPSADAMVWLDSGSVHALEIPEFGWILADGVNPLRLIRKGTAYAVGGLAPSTAPTLAVTGAVRASIVGTWTHGTVPGNNETITLGLPGASTTILFVTAFNPAVSQHQVKRVVGDEDATFENLQALIQGTGTSGVEYFNYLTYTGFEDDFQVLYKVEVSAIDTASHTITFRFVDYGVGGNACTCTETVTGFSFAGASTVFTGGTDGTGTAPNSGTYRYFWTWYRSVDGAETGRSPTAEITKTTNANIDVTGISACPDTSFDFIRLYRTEKQGVEFFLSGAVLAATGTYTDDVSDQDLARGTPWNDLNYRDYTEGMPPRGRALAYWKDAVWTLGAHLAAEYTKGTVAVTNGSATVTFSATGIHARMVGRTFQVDDTSETYRLLSLTPSGPTAVLDRVYEGVTGGTSGFTIRDDYDASRLRASLTFKPNQWPVERSPGRIETDDAEGGTALLATRSRLFAFSKTSIIAVTGDDIESWEVSKVTQGVGTPSPRMVVGVEGGGVFLSMDGFYALSPDTSVVSISSPKAPKGTVAQGIDDTVARIAWAHIDNGYSEYDPTDRVVVFGVPLDGASTPNYEIIFDLQNSTWALYKRAEWTALAQIVLPNGDQTLLAGDRDGNLWHVGLGSSDGFYGTAALQTLTGSQTTRVLTVTGTPFLTSGDGEEGKPVIVLYADGSTVGYGKVWTNTTSELTLAEDLETAPAAADQIVIGGIAFQAKSGYATGGEEYRSKTLRSVTVRHVPSTAGDYHFSFAVDSGSFRLCPVGTSIGDLTQANGKIRHMTQWPGDTHAINIRGFKPVGRAIIRGDVLDFIIRETGRG